MDVRGGRAIVRLVEMDGAWRFDVHVLDDPMWTQAARRRAAARAYAVMRPWMRFGVRVRGFAPVDRTAFLEVLRTHIAAAGDVWFTLATGSHDLGVRVSARCMGRQIAERIRERPAGEYRVCIADATWEDAVLNAVADALPDVASVTVHVHGCAVVNGVPMRAEGAHRVLYLK